MERFRSHTKASLIGEVLRLEDKLKAAESEILRYDKMLFDRVKKQEAVEEQLELEKAKAARLVEAANGMKFALQCMIIKWNGPVPGLKDQEVFDGAVQARNNFTSALAAYSAGETKGEG